MWWPTRWGQTRHGAKPAGTHENESSPLSLLRWNLFKICGSTFIIQHIAIHRINHYSVDSMVCLVNIYPLDSDLGSFILLGTSTNTLTDASVDISITTWSTLNRHTTNMSIDCRLRVNQCFGRTSPDVGQGIHRDHLGQLPAGYQSTISGVSVMYHSMVEQESTDTIYVNWCIGCGPHKIHDPRFIRWIALTSLQTTGTWSLILWESFENLGLIKKSSTELACWIPFLINYEYPATKLHILSTL